LGLPIAYIPSDPSFNEVHEWKPHLYYVEL